MARRRFYVDQIHHGSAELAGEDARHLERVLRAEPGQRYEISDTRSAWLAEIVEARKGRIVFRAIEPVPSPEFPLRMAVLAALVKFDRFEWMVEKAAELGADRIVPVECARTEKGLFEASRKRAERWSRIARESGQQARRLAPPDVLPTVRFEAALSFPVPARFFLDESGAPPLLGALPHGDATPVEAALLAGPEGGWTPEERARAAVSGWSSVSLGPQILRAETAVLAALAVILNAYL